MKGVVFAPVFNTDNPNTERVERDASGAFQPEAQRFNAVNGLERRVFMFNNRMPMRSRIETCQSRLLDESGVDVVAFFCHGWRDGIQAGYRLMNAKHLAAALKSCASPRLSVLLYACDTGRDSDSDRLDETAPGPGGEGGFADKLRDSLASLGVWARVFAHSTPGHTTQNPYVRVFDTERAGEVGGQWHVEPGSDAWRDWVRALKSDQRFTFWRY